MENLGIDSRIQAIFEEDFEKIRGRHTVHRSEEKLCLTIGSVKLDSHLRLTISERRYQVWPNSWDRRFWKRELIKNNHYCIRVLQRHQQGSHVIINMTPTAAQDLGQAASCRYRVS